MLQMKYKSKAKQLYVEVMKLRYQCSRSEQKKPTRYVQEMDTIEVCYLILKYLICSNIPFLFLDK